MLQLLMKLQILGVWILCKLLRSGLWVGCYVAATPKNSGLRLCFKPLVQISMMHLCGFEESFLMLCTVFLRLDVLPRNLITLPFSLGCFLLRFYVSLQWCWCRPGRWSLQCKHRIGFYLPHLGFSWLFPWILGGVHLGVAGHGHVCRISSGRWNMVSVVDVGVLHVCIFEVLFNIHWHGYV